MYLSSVHEPIYTVLPTYLWSGVSPSHEMELKELNNVYKSSADLRVVQISIGNQDSS